MGLKAAVQALKKAEPLKDKVQRCKDLLNDSDAWLCQQQLQKIYQQVLILDLEYALDRKVEQELWNLGFKNYIATLQSQTKDRKNPKRGESQAMLSWCLEAASGFYLTLLQEICTAFNLDLPFRRKNNIYGYISSWKAVEYLTPPHKSSCFYICQYCLVHLGDIARYRNQNKQAELFYRHAVSLSPSSGQPYNQLALLEASRGDKLGTVFHYVRSVAVKHPFPVAAANLTKTLSTALNDTSYNIEGKTKLSSEEYVAVFLKFHGVLHNLGDLSIAKNYVKLLNETLTALVATESFSSWRLIQMLVINLFALQHTAGVLTENLDLLRIEQLSSDEKISRDCILDLIAGSLSALLLPVYTIKSELISYFALPTIKLCLEWISLRPSILEEESFKSRLQIWPSLCVLLNGLHENLGDFNSNQYNTIPLPEDRDLQGFLTLEKYFETLRFSHSELETDAVFLNKLRAMRLIHLGRKISEYQVNDTILIKNEGSKFSTAVQTAGLCNELMKELEELSLNKEKHTNVANSPDPSESVSSKGSLEMDALVFDYSLEKRVGILKSQNSMDRNHEVLINNTEISNSYPAARKPRQNIAMQAILRRAETDQKQVTFKSVSPVDVEAEKIKSQISSTINILQPVTNINLNTTPILDNTLKIQGPNTSLLTNRQLLSTENKTVLPNQDLHKSSGYFQFHQVPQKINSSYNAANPVFNKNYLSNTVSSQQHPMQGHFSGIQSSKDLSISQSINMSQVPHTQQMIGKINSNITGMQQGIILPQNSKFTSGNIQSSVEPISSIPANLSNIQTCSTSMANFNYNNTEKQLPPPIYAKTGEYTFPAQNNSLPIYHNSYDPWKDPQLPQPPVTWWDKNSGQLLQNNTSSLCTNAFQNWANSPVTRDNYQQNPVHGMALNNRTMFQDVKQFDEKNDKTQEAGVTGSTYSLFSENSWSTVQSKNSTNQVDMMSRIDNQQSLWSGPGPSPLERLLEQQKSLREGGT